MNSDVNSVDALLRPEEVAFFEPGRTLEDVLAEMHWRGNFQMAAEYKGATFSAIGYLAVDRAGKGGHSIWALFVDDRFHKFVQWPSWENRSTIKLEEPWLVADALNAAPIDPVPREEATSGAPAGSMEFNPILALALWRYRGALEKRWKEDLKKNTELRDQYNAFRLRIGMTRSEVESVLNSKAIESGVIDAGDFAIYGSVEELDIMPNQHYSNILVIYKDGKVTRIYSGSMAPGGKHGLKEMRRWFVELPGRPGDEGAVH